MNSVIYDPLEEFSKKYKDLHKEHTTKFFDELVKQSGIDIGANQKTVKLYTEYKENLAKLRKKLNWRRFWRVLMCLTVVLIPVVILKLTPAIKTLRGEIEEADRKADELLAEANGQMLPLNGLFTDKDAIKLIETTLPLLHFEEQFTARQEEDMRTNYDFGEGGAEESALDVLAGRYNENPFLFENKVVHTMGTETYHGSKTIHWTETYRDSDGKLKTRTRSETLHASVTKPKPFFKTQVILNYCAQGGPDLSFSRDASHLEKLSEKEIERFVKRGEKNLKRRTDRAISEESNFMSMSNSDFEVLFDALDRNNEVQFRTLFTPLAQTNMVDLILSKEGYGDDFHFIKTKRSNRIIANHSQGRALKLSAKEYPSYSYDIIRDNFIAKNTEFFKAVYFDFAPLLAIPAYQERPVHSLKPIPDYSGLYALKECETLANAIEPEKVVHPDSETSAILKSSFVATCDNRDEVRITAYSYATEDREDVVSVFGGDGRYHNVYVPWKEYIPLRTENNFFVTKYDKNTVADVMAIKNGLCIYR